MANTIFGVLQAMDDIANVPALLSAVLLQPAPVRQRRQNETDLTPPRVVKRKRRLTLPLDMPVPEAPGKVRWLSKAIKQCTFDQIQSPLMRLPAEIREEIWRHVILGSKATLDRNDGVIEIGWRSTGSGHGRASAYKISFEKQRDQRGMGVLGMLCSCRIIYSETIHLIYSLPTFSFHYQNVETFFAFICAIPQNRKDRIRYLDLRWLSQIKGPDSSLQPPEHQLNPRWSYKRISNIRALSPLPKPVRERAASSFVYPESVVDEILNSMNGLKDGGVRWGHKSTGCFAQE